MSRLIVDNKFLIVPSSINNYVPEWVNDTWASFSSSGINITSMIDDTSIYNHLAHITPSVHLKAGDKIYAKYWLTLNAGSYPNNAPYFACARPIFGSIFDLTMNPAYNGHEYTVTIYVEDNYYFVVGNQYKNINASATFQFYTKVPLGYLSG